MSDQLIQDTREFVAWFDAWCQAVRKGEASPPDSVEGWWVARIGTFVEKVRPVLQEEEKIGGED